ncbi:NAD(P)/FAD-dependent oxidoreductase [Herbiconiux sp. YIM B11900]|uniref:NAD(P)/FAD-dependent oxidoreductase n=1 Tax=Herbiconiux sp. YIM B11900 TaxID=3404131 RepID=UPI003F87363D
MTLSTGSSPAVARALADARPTAFWTDQPGAPEPGEPVAADTTADLVIVGGGFTGLWSAWRALDRDPGLDVLVLEAEHVGFGASGRNGGFISSSLTHGIAHGSHLWPGDLDALHAEGEQNLTDLVAQVTAAGIDCDLQTVGKTSIAVEPWQVDALGEAAELARSFGEDVEYQDAAAVQADVHSASFLAGLRARGGTAMVDPAKLAWGMARVLRERGARIAEGSPVASFEKSGGGIRMRVNGHTVHARQAVVATAAYPSPLKRLRTWIMPLYDHVLMTEPLSAAQLASIGWNDRQGLTDAGNQFHYFRLSADDRILWGGWDALYYRGGRVSPALEQNDSSHELLARQFFETFPQLAELRFTHRWAGPIDSTTRFTAAYGTAFGGDLAYAAGHTGLGVGAARFSADVALDLLAGEPTSRTRYEIVRKRPFPIPPEPFRNPIVQFTRSRMIAADDNAGRRGLWLRTLDRFGLGFNS